MARATIRTPMPIKMRAKQFAMFDALKGLTEAIAEKERQVYPRKELSEERISEINLYLKALTVGDYVSLIYYCWYGNNIESYADKLVELTLIGGLYKSGK